MGNTNDTVFTVNELIAMSAALENQIEDCQDLLSDPSLALVAKTKIQQTLRYSNPALSRLNAIFRENNV